MTLYQEMKYSELKSDLSDIKDESQLTSEEMSEECHYVEFVRTEGNFITLSS